MLCGSFRLYKLITNRFVSDLYHYVCIYMHVASLKTVVSFGVTMQKQTLIKRFNGGSVMKDKGIDVIMAGLN